MLSETLGGGILHRTLVRSSFTLPAVPCGVYSLLSTVWCVFTVVHLSSLLLSPCFMPGWSASESVVFLPLAIQSRTICYGGLSLVEEW